MERISRDDMLMEIAHVVAKRATCSRAQVGAVFSRDGRIISTGYNGAPAGMAHCDHTCLCGKSKVTPPTDNSNNVLFTHHEWCPSIIPCEIVEHAERNAIAYAARYGLALDGSVVHVTHAPCLACAKSVINAGVKELYYQIPYRLTEGLKLLDEAGVDVTIIDPQH